MSTIGTPSGGVFDDPSSGSINTGVPGLMSDGTTSGQFVSASRTVNASTTQALLSLNLVGDRIVVPVAGMDVVTVSSECISGSWPTSTLTQKVSNDGFRFDAISGAATITGEGTTVGVTVTGYAYYAIEVTTKAASAAKAAISVQARATN